MAQFEAGAKFETVLENFFRDAGVSIETEMELKQNNIGKLAATPDLVLLDEVYIDGARVHWIDAKSFYGSLVVEQHEGKLLQQAAKYEQRFGPGAFVFKSGACKQLDSVCGALVLDGRWFTLRKVLRATSLRYPVVPGGMIMKSEILARQPQACLKQADTIA